MWVQSAPRSKLAAVGDPNRFASVRQFWAYAGLGVERRVSSEHRVENGRAKRSVRVTISCRLNRNYHPRVKKVMKDVALGASLGKGELREIYDAHVARGKRASIARVALARRVASILFAMWRSGRHYDASMVTTKNKMFGASIEGTFSPVATSPEALR